MKYYVCHGPNAVHYIEVEDGSTFSTGQPNSEEFTDEAAARARAEELGYDFSAGQPVEPNQVNINNLVNPRRLS